MHSVNYYIRSPPDVQDSRIEEFIEVSKVLEYLHKPDKRQNCSNELPDSCDKSVWRTVSPWMNQSENVLSQRVRKRDKPAKQENRRRTVSTFIEKRDKPAVEKFYYTSNGDMFCLTIMYFLKKFRKSQTRFSRNARKISL